jgi:low affinity Fe/Cu permease
MTNALHIPFRLLLATSVAAILTAGVALGQAEIDTDGDGMVSYTELLLVMPDMTEEDFTALDANEDGMLDAEEFAAAEEAGLITMG